MRYRQMKAGEIVEPTDEYISYHTPSVYGKVADVTVGQRLLECNVKYYRRPMKDEQQQQPLALTDNQIAFQRWCD